MGEFVKLLIDNLSDIYDNYLKCMDFPAPLIFIIKEKRIYYELYIPSKESSKNKGKRIFQNLKDFLKKIKEI